MKYMLDTSIIAYANNNRPESVLRRFLQCRPEDMCVFSITLAELEFDVYNSVKPGQNQLALMTFLSRIPVMPFDAEAAAVYGVIRADLTKKGALHGLLGKTPHQSAFGCQLPPRGKPFSAKPSP